MVLDYIVVGAGGAGAVVASRLSAIPDARVAVLEAGPPDVDKMIKVPTGFARLFRSGVDWDYLTEPQAELRDRRIYWPRGKTLGGSTSINAMMWVRGFPADYDEWGELTDESWDYAHVGGLLDDIEAGPLVVSEQRSPRRLTAKWLAAAAECGYPVQTRRTEAPTPDREFPDVFGLTRVLQRRGRRWSTADAYLRPAGKRLQVITGATVTKVLIENGRAVGVEYEHDGRRQTLTARREVVLCGGAVNSAQLLMLSGVGDREHLEQFGIDVVAHSPQVGQNLTDHLSAAFGFDVDGDTLAGAERPLQLANFLVRRRGMLTSIVAEAYGFVRSRPDLEWPDIELLFAPAPFYDEGIGEPYLHHAVAMGPVLVRPQSRGTISLRSADPFDKPVIDPRYLTDPQGADRAAMIEGLRITARIAQAPALRSVLGRIVRPLDVTELNDDALTAALETTSFTLYHPVGTCRMGKDDASVVDPRLRVRGVESLRVADASVMPAIIRGHTQAPSVLIGERAATLVAAAR